MTEINLLRNVNNEKSHKNINFNISVSMRRCQNKLLAQDKIKGRTLIPCIITLLQSALSYLEFIKQTFSRLIRTRFITAFGF